MQNRASMKTLVNPFHFLAYPEPNFKPTTFSTNTSVKCTIEQQNEGANTHRSKSGHHFAGGGGRGHLERARVTLELAELPDVGDDLVLRERAPLAEIFGHLRRRHSRLPAMGQLRDPPVQRDPRRLKAVPSRDG